MLNQDYEEKIYKKAKIATATLKSKASVPWVSHFPTTKMDNISGKFFLKINILHLSLIKHKMG